MAEVLALTASLAGLLSLAGSITKLICTLRDASKDGPNDLQNIETEINNISVLAEELQECLLQQDICQAVQLVTQKSNFHKVIKETIKCFKDIEANLVMLGLRKPEASQKRLGYRVQTIKAAKHLKKYEQTLQRQKLIMLLALSTFSLHTQLQINQSARSITSIVENSDASLQELRCSIAKTHDIVLRILENQHISSCSMTTVQSAVLQQIDLHLEQQPAMRVQRQNGVSGKEKTLSFDAYATENSFGVWELAYGSLSLFKYGRFRKPVGAALRASYVFPSWLARMMISISFIISSFSRHSIAIGIHYVAEVPWESDIFTFAQSGNVDGIARLFLDGKAAPTDRDNRGVTALHLASYRQDIPMCKLLLSEGADPSAIMRYSSLEGLHITPLRYLALSSRFRSLPTYQQQEMLFLLGTNSFPKIRMRRKSVVQLFLAPSDIECTEGPLREQDLKKLDLVKTDNCLVTYLMVASEFGSIYAVKVLIEHQIDVNAVDIWGNSALHYAADSGHGDCIEELLVAGAIWQRMKNKDGVTPDMMASTSGHSRVWKKAMQRAVIRRRELVRNERRTRRIAREIAPAVEFSWLFEQNQYSLNVEVENSKFRITGSSFIKKLYFIFWIIFIFVFILSVWMIYN